MYTHSEARPALRRGLRGRRLSNATCLLHYYYYYYYYYYYRYYYYYYTKYNNST